MKEIIRNSNQSILRLQMIVEEGKAYAPTVETCILEYNLRIDKQKYGRQNTKKNVWILLLIGM